MAETNKIWGIDEEDTLVEMWSAEPCLYDVCSREFKNRAMRDRALEKISSSLECTVSEVWRHMTSLRTQYGRAQQRPKSGSAAKGKTPRQKWLIDNLKFLSKSSEKQPSSSNMDTEDEIEEVQESAEEDEEKDEENSSFISTDDSVDVEIATASTQSCTKRPLTTKPKKNLKKSRDDEEFELLKQLTKIATQPFPAPQPTPAAAEPDDEDSVFARWLLHEIRGISDNRAKAYIKNQIQNLIYNFKFGNIAPQQGFGSLVNQSVMSVEPTYHHM